MAKKPKKRSIEELFKESSERLEMLKSELEKEKTLNASLSNLIKKQEELKKLAMDTGLDVDSIAISLDSDNDEE